MNIAQMVVALGVDPKGVETGLQRGEAEIKGFLSGAKKLFGDTALLDPHQMTAVGSGAAQALIQGLTSEFDATIGDARQKLENGLIDTSAFAELGADASAEFNDGLTGGIRGLKLAGLLSPQIAAQISDSFKGAGLTSGTAFAKEARGVIERLLASGHLKVAIPATVATDQLPTQLQAGLSRLAEQQKAVAAPVTPQLIIGPAVSASKTMIAQLSAMTKSAAEARDALGQPLALEVTGTKDLLVSAEALDRLAAAEVASVGANEKMQAGLKGASEQVALYNKEIRLAIEGNEAWAKGMAEVSAGTGVAGAGMTHFDHAQHNVLDHGKGGARALHSISNSLVLIGATAIDAEGPLLKLAEGLVLFSGGIGGILAVGAALFGVGLIINKLTAKHRAAKEVIDKEIESLEKLHEAQRDPVRVALEVSGDANKRLEELRETEKRLLDRKRELEATPIQVLGDRGDFAVQSAAVEIANIDAKLKALGLEFVKTSKAAAAGGLDVLAKQTQDLSDALSLGVGNAKDFEDGIARIQALNAEARDGAADLSKRNDAQRKANELLTSGLGPLQAQLDALTTIREAQGQLGSTTIQFNTAGAVRELDALDQKLKRLEDSVNSDQRPFVLKVRVALDVERAKEQLAPLQRQFDLLQQQRQSAARLGTNTVKFDVAKAQEQLGKIEAELDKLREKGGPDAKAIVLKFQAQVETESIDAFQSEVQRKIKALDLSVAITTDPDPMVKQIRAALGLPIPVGIDAQPAIKQAEDLRDAIGKVIAQAGGEDRAEPALVEAFAGLTASLQKALEAPFVALTQEATQVQAQLDAATATIEAQRGLAAGAGDAGATVRDLAVQAALLAPLVSRVRDEYEKVTAEINAGVASTAHLIELQNQQAALAAKLHEQQTAPAAFTGAVLGPLEDAAKRYEQARTEFEAALAHGLPKEASAAAAEMDRAGKVLDQGAKAAVRMVLSLKLDADTTKAILDAIAKKYAEINRLAGQVSESQKKLGHSLDIAGQSVSLLGDVRDAIQGTGRDAGDAIGNVQDLGHALSDVGKSIASGDVFGAIQAGVRGIKSIGNLLGFGKSETEKLLEQAVKDNTAAVNRGTQAALEAAGKFEGIRGISQRQQLVQRVADSPAAQAALASHDLNAFRDAVQATGLTLGELRAIGREFGISFEKDHHLVAGATEALQERLRQAAAAAEGFTASLDDQTQLVTLQSRLRGDIQDPLQQFKNSLDALKGAGVSEAITGLFADPSNIDAVRKSAQDLLEQFKNKTLDPNLLGTLSNTDFLTFLGQAADYLDSFNKSVNDATQGALNLPDAFRQSAAEFAASLPDPPPPPTIDATKIITTGLKGIDLLPSTEMVSTFKALSDAFAKTQLEATGALTPIASELQKLAAGLPTGLSDAITRLGTTTAPDLLDAVGQLQETTAPDLLDAVNRVRDAVVTLASRPQTSSTAPAPTPVAPSLTLNIPPGGIVLMGGPTRSPALQADEFLRALRLKAVNATGDSARIGEVT